MAFCTGVVRRLPRLAANSVRQARWLGTHTHHSRLHAEIEKALNNQVTRELESSSLYLAAAYWFDSRNFKGICKYFKAESDDERVHAKKIADYIAQRGGLVHVSTIEAPRSQWVTATEVVTALYEAELQNSGSLNAIAEKAIAHNDHATRSFLNFFHDNQVAEEDKMETIVRKVDAYNKLPGLMYHLDSEMG